VGLGDGSTYKLEGECLALSNWGFGVDVGPTASTDNLRD